MEVLVQGRPDDKLAEHAEVGHLALELLVVGLHDDRRVELVGLLVENAHAVAAIYASLPGCDLDRKLPLVAERIMSEQNEIRPKQMLLPLWLLTSIRELVNGDMLVVAKLDLFGTRLA